MPIQKDTGSLGNFCGPEATAIHIETHQINDIPVAWAVHRLECKDLFLHLKGEHVIAVVLPMPGGLPQLAVVNVWCHHLLEASLLILILEVRKHIN